MRTLRAHVLPLAGMLVLLAASSAPLDPAPSEAAAPSLLRCERPSPAAPDRRPIGPRGGSLELPTGHTLAIPPRSLAAARDFAMSELGGDTVGVRIDSGERPAAFGRSALLTLSYRHCPDDMAIDSLVVVRIESGGTLTPLPSQHDARRRTVGVALTGNSDYALAVP